MIIIFFGFFFLSLFSNTLAPFITTIKNVYGVSDDTIAILPSIVYCSSFVMSIVGSRIMHILGIEMGLVTGFILAILSSIVILFSNSFCTILIGYFISGLAVGMGGLFLGTAISLLPKKYQKFSFANACFGLGGILILPIARFVLKSSINFNYTYIIHIVLMLLLLILVGNMNITSSVKKIEKNKGSIHILKDPMILLLSISVFFYVGAEISTTNWTGSFLERYYGLDRSEVPVILSSFWLLFTLGRALGDKLLEMVGQLRFLFAAPLVSVAGIFVVLSGTSRIQALIGISIIGISISIIYPALQGYMVQHVDRGNIPAVSSITIIFNNFGAAFLTYIIGFAGGRNVIYVFVIQIVFYIYISFTALYYLIRNKKFCRD